MSPIDQDGQVHDERIERISRVLAEHETAQGMLLEKLVGRCEAAEARCAHLEQERDEAQKETRIALLMNDKLQAEHEQLCNGLKDLSRYETEEIEGSSGYFVDWNDISELLEGTK